MTTWRGRFLLRSFADLPGEFRVGGYDCRSQPVVTEPTGRHITLVDLTIHDVELKDAYFRTIDSGEELADRVSFLTYAPATAELISVTVPQVKLGEEFSIALPVEGYRRSRVRVASADIAR